MSRRPGGAVVLAFLVLLALPAAASQSESYRPKGIWMSYEEISKLPTSGPAWDNLKSHADKPAGVPDLSNQNEKNNVLVLAKALVYARTRQEKYRDEVIDQCMMAIGTERNGLTLSLGRDLAAYVISADLVGLPKAEDARFRRWLKETLTEDLGGKTLRSTHEIRPNNWGTAAGASRIAVALYLGDQEELRRAAEVFKAWLGEPSCDVAFRFKHVEWWQADPDHPKGINPKGATKEGHSIDGVLPEEMRRASPFQWPPPKENYVWTALQGAIVQAVLLKRAGYPAFAWGDEALLRAYKWLYDVAHYPAKGDDVWQMPLVDFYYGTHFWNGETPKKCGKIMCWTDWTHGTRLGRRTQSTGSSRNHAQEGSKPRARPAAGVSGPAAGPRP